MTSGITSNLQLTRQELSKILPTDKAIRAFEELFSTVTTLEEEYVSPQDVIDVSIDTGAAYNTAIQASSDLRKVTDISRGANVLLWLSM